MVDMDIKALWYVLRTWNHTIERCMRSNAIGRKTGA